ncbi:hypothetical protein BG011_002588 [Mortierella polycephala]|uniref:Uncharacterized protein n=1 Tax=Mortierella polycephala TaxID=41804 RepID=A0A9P6PKF7_9FUNG|nr:hypothetical protein BG011_002588 [Mortierella polycephala]
MTVSREGDARNLKNGNVRWIKMPFPYDRKWDLSGPYASHFKQYHSLYVNDMPAVPALMTYCIATREDEPSKSTHYHRVNWHSMVLRPEKWIISKDHNGLSPINGTDTKGKVSVETTETTNIIFKNSIEFSASVTASGNEGPITSRAELKASASRKWEKSISVVVYKSEETDQGYSYQPTNIYAQLLCKVVVARRGSFMVSGFYDYDLISSNPRGVEVKTEHKASSMESAIGAMNYTCSQNCPDI